MMNNGLISRSALFKAWDTLDEAQDPNLLVDAMIKATQDAPAVDAEVVRHGRWIEVVTYDQDGDCLDVEYKCSECGRLEGLNDEPYCNCGAKMGGKEDAAD